MELSISRARSHILVSRGFNLHLEFDRRRIVIIIMQKTRLKSTVALAVTTLTRMYSVLFKFSFGFYEFNFDAHIRHKYTQYISRIGRELRSFGGLLVC